MKEEKRKSFLAISLPTNKNTTNSIHSANSNPYDDKIHKHKQLQVQANDQYKLKQKSKQKQVRVIKRIGRKQVISSFNAQINQQNNANKMNVKQQFVIKVTKAQQEDKQKQKLFRDKDKDKDKDIKKKLKRVGKKVWVANSKQEEDDYETCIQADSHLLQPSNTSSMDQYSDFKQLSKNNSYISDHSANTSSNKQVLLDMEQRQKIINQMLQGQQYGKNLQNIEDLLNVKNQQFSYQKQKKNRNRQTFNNSNICNKSNYEQVTSDIQSEVYKNQQFLQPIKARQPLQYIQNQVNIQKMLQQIQTDHKSKIYHHHQYLVKKPIQKQKQKQKQKQVQNKKQQLQDESEISSSYPQNLHQQKQKQKQNGLQYTKQKLKIIEAHNDNKMMAKKISYIFQLKNHTPNKPRQSLRKQYKRQSVHRRQSRSQNPNQNYNYSTNFNQNMNGASCGIQVAPKNSVKKPLLPAYPFNQKNDKMLESDILKRKTQIMQQKLPVRIKKQNSITPSPSTPEVTTTTTMTTSKVQLNKIKLRAQDKKDKIQNKQNYKSMHSSQKKQIVYARKHGLQKLKNATPVDQQPRMASSLIKNSKKLQINRFIAEAKKQIVADHILS